jgi:hypothetical protein
MTSSGPHLLKKWSLRKSRGGSKVIANNKVDQTAGRSTWANSLDGRMQIDMGYVSCVIVKRLILGTAMRQPDSDGVTVWLRRRREWLQQSEFCRALKSRAFRFGRKARS